MAFPARAILLALAAAAPLPGMAQTQQTPEVFASNGGNQTTYSDTFSASCIKAQPPNPYKQVGMNPLTCHGEMAPQDSAGQCSLAGMTVIAHQGSMCYYCLAMNPPANLYIPLDQIASAQSQGFECGASQVDPNCMAICTKQGQPSGGKGMYYTPPSQQGGGTATPKPANPPPNQNPPLNYSAIDSTMLACINAKAPYASPGPPDATQELNALQLAPASLRSVALSQLPAADQIIVHAMALAMQAQTLRDQKYGISKYDPTDETEFMAGYLLNCLFKAGVNTGITGQNAFQEWNNYLGMPQGTIQDRPVAMFSQGWYWSNMGMNPLPLMPPDQQPLNPNGISGAPAIEMPVPNFPAGSPAP